MPRKLGLKLILSLTVIVILISAVSGYVYMQAQKRRLLDTMVLGADQLSRSITGATWHAMLADNREAAYEIMRLIAHKQGIDGIRMFNREGQLMFSSQPAERLRAGKDSEYCAPCHRTLPVREQLAVPSRVRISAHDGRRTLNMVTPIYNEPSCSNAACHAHPAATKVLGVLDVGLRLDPVEQEEADIRMQVLLATGAQILLSGIFIVIFTRRFVETPIQELIAGTKAVSAMDLDRPIQIRHKSQELDDLAGSFDLMRERLRAALGELNEFTQRLESKVSERTEQLRVAHQKLLHSDRLASLGQLSASVAHEINNPLSGVLNLSMLMQRIMKDGGVPAGREAEFRKYLSQIVSETSRVGRIVSDLLAFSRRSKPQRTSADLNKIVRSTVSLVGHRLKLAETEATLDLAENLPTVPCDPSQIQQVAVNLVLNASEATQNRKAGAGRIRVATRLLTSGDAVQLIVEDNGEGIAPENLDKVFDPFFTTKPEGKGVGLGLAVLYGIVQAHDGEVDVKSQVGRGTTFTVTLPLKPADTPPVPAVRLTTMETHAGPSA
jgi:two-component system NtrC family sensor kinase